MEISCPTSVLLMRTMEVILICSRSENCVCFHMYAWQDNLWRYKSVLYPLYYHLPGKIWDSGFKGRKREEEDEKVG